MATESGIRNKRPNDKLGQTPKASDRQRWRTLITALYAIVVAGSNGFSDRQSGIDKDFTQRITLTLNRILIQIQCKTMLTDIILVNTEQDWMKEVRKDYYIGFTQV